jgi:hypothetical protein
MPTYPLLVFCIQLLIGSKYDLQICKLDNFITKKRDCNYGCNMTLEGYTEYKAREFCNDVTCPVQATLNTLKDKPEAYELIRQTCRTACRYSTWQFHHWLIEKGYLILKPLKEKV